MPQMSWFLNFWSPWNIRCRMMVNVLDRRSRGLQRPRIATPADASDRPEMQTVGHVVTYVAGSNFTVLEIFFGRILQVHLALAFAKLIRRDSFAMQFNTRRRAVLRL